MRRNISSFGFLFDIDGVFLRGRNVLPEARKAFELLIDKNGRWRIPAVFVTNAGNSLRKEKANRLSELFNVEVHKEQVVMSHSPLTMFKHFHDKYMLISGQGPIKQIAENIGFKNVITIDEFSAHYPTLDSCDHKRRKAAPCAFEHYNRPVEGVVLFGEPVKWEGSLQLILDVLMSDGQPFLKLKEPLIAPSLNYLSTNRRGPNYPHLPVLACNTDLMWMSEAPMSRLAHGSFLAALESLYEKFTGHRLLYTALVGKPSELTYHHAMGRLNYVASKFCAQEHHLPVKRVYCVGDNPQTDIYGANLYNRYLQVSLDERYVKRGSCSFHHQVRSGSGVMRLARSLLARGNLDEIATSGVLGLASCSTLPSADGSPTEINFSTLSSTVSQMAVSDGLDGHAEAFESILVLTGVYQQRLGERMSMDEDQVTNLLNTGSAINHNHRDFPDIRELAVPQHLARDVSEAVTYAFRKEKYNPCD